jgi:hypothetical protein
MGGMERKMSSVPSARTVKLGVNPEDHKEIIADTKEWRERLAGLMHEMQADSLDLHAISNVPRGKYRRL